MLGGCQSIGGLNPVGIDIDAEHTTTQDFGDVERVTPRAAADLEHVRLAIKVQETRNFRRFFASHPTGLSEILAVGFEANLTIDVGVVSGVGGVVEVYLFRHREILLRRAASCGDARLM